MSLPYQMGWTSTKGSGHPHFVGFELPRASGDPAWQVRNDDTGTDVLFEVFPNKSVFKTPVQPLTNNAYALGGSSLRWSTVYGVDGNFSGALAVTGALTGGAHSLTGASHTESGLTTGNVLRATGATTFGWGAVDLADTDAVTGLLPHANLADLAALSVFGRASNSSGVMAAISAGTDKQVLRRSGTSIAFGSVDLASSDAITGLLPFANIADGTALSVFGRSANSSGVQASIAAGSDHQVMRRSGTSIAFGAVNLAQGAAVTGLLPLANLADLTALSVLGRAANTDGVQAAITAGTDGHVLRRSGTAVGFGLLAYSALPTGYGSWDMGNGYSLALDDSLNSLVFRRDAAEAHRIRIHNNTAGGTVHLFLKNDSAGSEIYLNPSNAGADPLFGPSYMTLDADVVLALASAGAINFGPAYTHMGAFTAAGAFEVAANMAVGGLAGSYGGGTGVIAIKNAAANPGSNPTGGGVLYADGGALKYRGSSGTVTTVAPA